MARHAAAAEKGEGEGKPFDYIILETSGLADPGNLVPLFWVDEGLGSSLFLDGVVCLVDAGNLVRSLEEPSEDERAEVGGNREETVAHRQISGADVLVLNKCDRIPTAEELERVEERARSVNGLAKVVRTEYGRVPQLEGWLLDLRAYDGIEAVDTLERGKRRRGGHVDPVSATFLFVSLGPILLCYTTPPPPSLLTLMLRFQDHLHHLSPPPNPHARPIQYTRKLAPLPTLGCSPSRPSARPDLRL